MKVVSMQEAKDQLEQLIEEASCGELIEITNGDKKVFLAPNYMFLDLEEGSPELEVELLKAVNGPHSPYSSEEMRAACEQIAMKATTLKEEGSSELKAELLKTAKGPFKPFRITELREIADRALAEHRAKQVK
jgi:hypothetical protein